MYTILHVETSLTYQAVVKKICREIHVNYINARSSDEAFDILSESSVNLILTAMEMEGANSTQFITSINESSFRNIPIVVFTGNDTEEDRKRMFDLGIVDYISKLSNPDEIRYNLETYKNDDDILVKIRDLKIAVCDDSLVDRFIFERIFKMVNVSGVDFYTSGEDLLSSNKRYDVYLVDMVLKNMSGSLVVRKLREEGSDSVIMTISGIDHYKTISNVLNMGANDYITKPFNNELFMARLKTNIRGYLLLQEVKLKTRQLEQMAITDGLTGIYNRRHLLYLLDQEIRKVERNGNSLSIMMLDIDHFKKINDTYGHQFGDQVLIRVTEVIRKTMRDTDVLGRYGGEEFIVIFPDTPLDGAKQIAERIRAAMACLKSNKVDFSVSVSGGVEEWKNHDLRSLIMEADMLLYCAKKNGRNRIEHR